MSAVDLALGLLVIASMVLQRRAGLPSRGLSRDPSGSKGKAIFQALSGMIQIRDRCDRSKQKDLVQGCGIHVDQKTVCWKLAEASYHILKK